MAYRSIMVAHPARISCQLGQLIVQSDQRFTFPIEDIACLMLESRQSSITTAALSALAENGTVVYCCDEKHLPCGTLLPFAQHCRQLEVSTQQLGIRVPLQKRLWQKIVQSKIHNQGECLALCGKTEKAAWLFSRKKAVASGDSDNIEAAAAASYFPELFGDGFTRSNECDGRNAALNYGYAILRGCMARCLCSYGFLPWIGIHHCSTLNAFNLADDMMEPYRPVVDLYVAANLDSDVGLNTSVKGQLFDLLNADILSGKQHHSVAYAMERQVQSLRKAAETQSAELLLPLLQPTKRHQYE